MQEMSSPDFPFPVRWLRAGGLQLDLFESGDPAPRDHHFWLDANDIEAVYSRAEERGVRIREGYFSGIYELPDGAVQMYLRDPAGNMVEVDCRDATALDSSVVGGIEKVRLETEEGAKARLYVRWGGGDNPSRRSPRTLAPAVGT